MSKQAIKPPIGIEPESMWKERRMIDLSAAIGRRCKARLDIPVEWVDELNELLNETPKA